MHTHSPYTTHSPVIQCSGPFFIVTIITGRTLNTTPPTELRLETPSKLQNYLTPWWIPVTHKHCYYLSHCALTAPQPPAPVVGFVANRETCRGPLQRYLETKSERIARVYCCSRRRREVKVSYCMAAVGFSAGAGASDGNSSGALTSSAHSRSMLVPTGHIYIYDIITGSTPVP